MLFMEQALCERSVLAHYLYFYYYRNSFSLQGVLETKLRLLPVEPDPGNAGEGKEKKMATDNVAICFLQLYISLFQFVHCMISRTGRQCHIRQTWILSRCRCHTRPVSYKNIFTIVHLVPLIEYA